MCAPGDWFYPYVMDLHNMGAVGGYPDGTFLPNNNISRAQVMKVIVLAYGLEAIIPSSPTFADVPRGSHVLRLRGNGRGQRRDLRIPVRRRRASLATTGIAPTSAPTATSAAASLPK